MFLYFRTFKPLQVGKGQVWRGTGVVKNAVKKGQSGPAGSAQGQHSSGLHWNTITVLKFSFSEPWLGLNLQCRNADYCYRILKQDPLDGSGM